ncbi:MAG: D-sedoheptulose-7-phosphate isomerase [Candidatus Aminicenantales bacterium]
MSYERLQGELNQILRDFFEQKGSLLSQVTEAIAEALKKGRKILVFGNGGSAAEAQHFAAELVNKFMRVRLPIRAVALTTDTSCLTSIANDSGYDFVFSRQIEALADEGDIALALSTSGTSANIVEALKLARRKGLLTVALTGQGGGRLGSLADYLLDVPSSSTPRIQEVHLFLLHLLAEALEKRLFPNSI